MTFNPFTTFNSGSSYSTYVQWNGKTFDTHTELKSGEIYRVTSADISAYCTYLNLQSIRTGECLKYSYNSLLFKPLPGFIGVIKDYPLIGSPCNLLRLDFKKNTFSEITTSQVQGMEVISDRVWNVITKNSVYTVELLK